MIEAIGWPTRILHPEIGREQALEIGMAGGLIPLGSWGVLEVTGASAAHVETASGAAMDVAPEIAQYFGNTVFWLDDDGGRLLLVPRTGDHIWQIDLREGKAREIDWLIRDEDEGLRFTSVHSGPAGLLFVLYERGLVCLEEDGRKRWHSLHDDLSAEYVGVEDDRVVLRQQWPPELADREHKFRITSGEALPEGTSLRPARRVAG